MLVSSFSVLILKFTIVGQIMLLKKTTGCQVKGKTGSCNGKVGKQKGGEREKKTKLSIKNNRQVSKGREKEEFEADRK